MGGEGGRRSGGFLSGGVQGAGDYASVSPIEPSDGGGRKIARAIVAWRMVKWLNN